MEVLWKRHCEAVKLIKPEAEGTSKRMSNIACSDMLSIHIPGPI